MTGARPENPLSKSKLAKDVRFYAKMQAISIVARTDGKSLSIKSLMFIPFK